MVNNRAIALKGNLRFRLQGLEIMNDDPTQVDILYAQCYAQDDTIQKLADHVCDAFLNSGEFNVFKYWVIVSVSLNVK